MNSFIDIYNLNWLRLIKKYLLLLILIFSLALILGYFFDKNYNVQKEGVNFRINFSYDQNAKEKYIYAYDLIEYLYKINSSVIINPTRVHEVSNTLNLINYKFKKQVNSDLKKLFNKEKDESLNIFSSMFINNQNNLEFEFEVTSNKKLNYSTKEVIVFQKNLIFSLNDLLFNEFINYYKLSNKHSFSKIDTALEKYDLDYAIKKLDEIRENLFDQPELLGIYQFMNNFIQNELQIQKNKNELSEIIQDIDDNGLLKLVKITKIKNYSVQLFNIEFKVILPILFLIASIIFFIISDEYFKKRKN